MHLKHLFFGLAASLICFNASAQDKIYKRDGEIINASVKEINTGAIVYKRADNADGPQYTIQKKEVEKIMYQNGTEDDFGTMDEGTAEPRREHKSKRGKLNYKNNVLAVSPLQFTENGIGFGISYEHSIDKEGIISFYIPATMVFSIYNNDNNTYYNGTTYYNNNSQIAINYSVMPGFKFYPTGNKGKVKYAVGPSVVVTGGQKNYNDASYYPGPYNAQENSFETGILIQNYLNINPTPHLFLGIELGLGASYIYKLNGITQNNIFMAQGAFKIGYRF